MRSRWTPWILVWLLWPAGAAAQNADMLYGRVTDDHGQPLMGAWVEATSVLTEISISQITNRDGRYLIMFPDGGGLYTLRVTYIGRLEEFVPVVREGSEDLLLTNITLAPHPIDLEEVIVAVLGSVQARPGEETIVLPKEVLDALALSDREPETVAMLNAGIIGTGINPDTDRSLFSVGGLREELNRITLDGVALGEASPGIPQEGVRQIEVTTSQFDASRGGAAGGQVAVTSARGGARPSGTLTYQLDSTGMQLRASPTANAFTKHDVGGSWGGPLLDDRLFYNLSFQFNRNENHRFALAANDPLAAERSGVNVDSITRFLSILNDHSFPIDGQTGPYSHMTDDLRLQGRLDWNIARGNDRTHALSLRFNTNLNAQDSTRISTLDVMQHGGESGSDTRQLSLNVDSKFGQRATNVLNVSFQKNWSDAIPYLEIPEGQVRVTSVFADDTRGTKSLIFGGNRNMPTDARGRDVSLSEEISLVLPRGDQVHRVKVGGSLERNRGTTRSATNLFGTFRFASLEDFRNNLPDRYERTLTAREEDTGRSSISLFFSDAWRIRQGLEVTIGLRWDYSRLDQRPEYNSAVENAFGVRNDVIPAASAVSPRLSFSYTLPGGSSGGGGGGGGGGGASSTRSLTGGIGYFAGRAPTSIFSAAVRQTGLPDAELTLICIGSAVPIPDWDLYREDPDAAPTECADGEAGGPSSQSSRAPAVTIVRPDQDLPGSIRLETGYRTPLFLGLTGNFRYQYSLGRGMWGYRDLNLNVADSTRIGPDDRLFFGDPQAISERTGSVSMASSRLYPGFANVYEVGSNLRSASHQFITQVSGTLPGRLRANVNYTLGFARDQGSGSLAQVTTAGNPNEVEWARATTDRRHNLNVTLTYPAHPAVELSLTGRLQSGAPFTPLINRDVNGDGMRNDRAIIFDPSLTADTAIANGMRRLLDNVPDRVAGCLESQFGSVAGRNSCTGAWTQSLNMAVNFRPMLPNLQRRVTMTANVRNVLSGIDYLAHGRAGMKGWGEGQRADANLLEVTSFDQETETFTYQVNEGFGQDRRGPEAFRNAFSLTLSMRMALGGNPAQASRGYITPPSGGGGSGGRSAGGGGRGGAAGGEGARQAAPTPTAPPFLLPQLTSMLRAQRSDSPNATTIVGFLLVNPVRRVLELRDSLGLSEEQVLAVRLQADSLLGRFAPMARPLAEAIENLAPSILRPENSTFFGPDSDVQQRFDEEIQPQVAAAREDAAAAMRQVREVLTSEQWEMLPLGLRDPEQQTGSDQRGRQRFIAVIDRMLTNPVLAILDLRNMLGFDDDQQSSLQSLADGLQRSLDERRATLAGRFEGLPLSEQPRVFREIQPDIQVGREEIRTALVGARSILTPSQWEQIPAAVRDPFTDRADGGDEDP